VVGPPAKGEIMEPSWKTLKVFTVEARPNGLWNLVTDYVTGSRLLRFRCLTQDAQGNALPDKWNPGTNVLSGADGAWITPARTGLLSGGALYGALIGKIGGSSADVPDNSQQASPYGSRRVFAVGSHCVISLGATEGGPLFLTMNDTPEGFANHSGALVVLVEECGT
jgi:hypothetical protein